MVLPLIFLVDWVTFEHSTHAESCMEWLPNLRALTFAQANAQLPHYASSVGV